MSTNPTAAVAGKRCARALQQADIFLVLLTHTVTLLVVALLLACPAFVRAMADVGGLCWVFPQEISQRAEAPSAEAPASAPSNADAACWQDDPQSHVARLGWNNDPRATVKLSYNKRTKTCLVEIDLRVIRDGAAVMLSRSIGNTEGREYGHFIQTAHPHPGEASSILCDVFLSSGEALECHSERDFDEVVTSLLN